MHVVRFPPALVQGWTLWRVVLIAIGALVGAAFVGLTIYRIATL